LSFITYAFFRNRVFLACSRFRSRLQTRIRKNSIKKSCDMLFKL
jgi:hypothetical protein